jgi:hypothetical protein
MLHFLIFGIKFGHWIFQKSVCCLNAFYSYFIVLSLIFCTFRPSLASLYDYYSYKINDRSRGNTCLKYSAGIQELLRITSNYLELLLITPKYPEILWSTLKYCKILWIDAQFLTIFISFAIEKNGLVYLILRFEPGVEKRYFFFRSVSEKYLFRFGFIFCLFWYAQQQNPYNL